MKKVKGQTFKSGILFHVRKFAVRMPQNSILPVFLTTFFEFLLVESLEKLRYLELGFFLAKFGLSFCGLEFFLLEFLKFCQKKKAVLLELNI